MQKPKQGRKSVPRMKSLGTHFKMNRKAVLLHLKLVWNILILQNLKDEWKM